MFIVADLVSLSSQYIKISCTTKSVVQSSARNKHMNEWGCITGEYSDQCSPGSFGYYPFLSGGSVVVNSLFCMSVPLFMFLCDFGPCSVMQ